MKINEKHPEDEVRMGVAGHQKNSEIITNLLQ